MNLKERIEEKIHRHPDADDQEIAKLIWEEDHPGETWENKGPSEQYVGRVRRKAQALAGPPEFEVEIPEEDELPLEHEEGEEPPEEPAFREAFEPPEIEYPEEVRPPVDGFTQDDVQFLLVFTFDRIADWTGWEGWRFNTDTQGRLTDPNERRFAQLTGRMADKYLPDILDQYFLEIMFCYTGVMLIGGRAIEYGKWRKERRPRKPVESSIVEPEQPEEAEIPDAEAPETPTNDEPEREPRTLPYGAKAHGEAEFSRRLRREPE